MPFTGFLGHVFYQFVSIPSIQVLSIMNGYIGKSEFQIQFPNTGSVRIATSFISAGYDIIHAFAHQSFKGHFF